MPPSQKCHILKETPGIKCSNAKNLIQGEVKMKTLLLGDLSPTDSTNPLFEKHDLQTLFSDTLPLFEGNDINFVNMECVLTDSEKSIEKFGPPLKATAETAKVMKKLNFNYCTVCNNHFFDFGIKGVKDSFKILDDLGITYTGFGENYEKILLLKKTEKKSALLQYVNMNIHML